jgi:hypothetical protein
VKTLLHQVLEEIKRNKGSLNMNELGDRLGVERSALEGMVAFWVRKGRLKDDEKEMSELLEVCGGCGSGGSCPGPASCAFTIKPPRTFTLNLRED